jgi:hypothetical protein
VLAVTVTEPTVGAQGRPYHLPAAEFCIVEVIANIPEYFDIMDYLHKLKT